MITCHTSRKRFPLFNLNMQAVIIGIILLIFSIVMKQAVKMHEEQRLTI